MPVMTSILATPRPAVRTERTESDGFHSHRRAFAPVLACYLGLAVIVGLAVLVHQFLPTPIALIGFVVAAAALVLALHPLVALRR